MNLMYKTCDSTFYLFFLIVEIRFWHGCEWVHLSMYPNLEVSCFHKNLIKYTFSMNIGTSTVLPLDLVTLRMPSKPQTHTTLTDLNWKFTIAMQPIHTEYPRRCPSQYWHGRVYACISDKSVNSDSRAAPRLDAQIEFKYNLCIQLRGHTPPSDSLAGTRNRLTYVN